MAVMNLTEARIRDLAPGSGIWRDEQVKGLMVVCHKSTKTYAVQGDVRRNGRHVRTVRVKIDRCDRIGLREARNKAKSLMSQIQSGVDPTAGPDETGVTLKAALDHHLSEKQFRPATAESYRYHLDKYLTRFRSRAVADITRTEVRDLYETMKKQRGQTTASCVMRTLRAVINTAMRLDETIEKNPVAVLRGGDRTPEELAAMLDGIGVTHFRDHTRWLEIMMASHHATAGDGREEFIAWSTGDPLFAADAAIIGRRWDSLNADRTGRQITERTLFKALVDAGRADLLPRDSVDHDFPDDLPPLSEDDAAVDPITAKVLEMNKQFCAVLEGGDYSIFMEDMDEIFDPPRRVWTPLSRSAFRFYHENELVALPDQKQRKSVADVWLQHPRMRKYPGIAMDPEGKHPNKLNLWQGWSVKPVPGDWSLTRELIDEVLCADDAACADYVRRWIAFMLQHPGVRPETAVAFRGPEGTGKSTLGRVLMRIAGAHGMTVSSPTQFAGRFNAHLRNIAFLFADEAFWPGDKGAEGTLKQLVTEPVISFEPKGKDIKTGRNLVHLMMASNESWVVPAGVEARRFAVFDVTDRRKNDRAFFTSLWTQLDQGGLGGMVYDLMRLDLDGWHPAHNPPRTQALAEQKLMSLAPPAKFWFEALDRGELPGVTEAQWIAGPVSLTTERNTLLEDYDMFLKRNRIYSLKASHKALATAGKDVGLVAGKSKGDERAWTLPPLAEARLRFEARIGAQGLFV